MSKILSKLFGGIFKEKILVEVEEDSYNSHPLLTLNDHTLAYYRKNVKGNKDIPKDQAERKMTRNMLLAFKYKEDSLNKKSPRAWYAYGCLRFIVKDNKVIWMQNNLLPYKVWSKDWDKYTSLNKELEIESKYIK